MHSYCHNSSLSINKIWHFTSENWQSNAATCKTASALGKHKKTRWEIPVGCARLGTRTWALKLALRVGRRIRTHSTCIALGCSEKNLGCNDVTQQATVLSEDCCVHVPGCICDRDATRHMQSSFHESARKGIKLHAMTILVFFFLCHRLTLGGKKQTKNIGQTLHSRPHAGTVSNGPSTDHCTC